MGKLLVLFTVVPLVELWLLLSIGDRIGFWPTVGIAIGTAVLGAVLAKREGRRVLGAWRDAVSGGRIPDEGITGGILVLLGAALLVTPGVLTDVAGLLLLFPPSRRWIAAAVRARMERRFAASGGLGGVVGAPDAGEGASWSVRVIEIGDPFGGAHAGEDEGRAARGEVIDVEAESVVVEEDGAARREEPARLPR